MNERLLMREIWNALNRSGIAHVTRNNTGVDVSAGVRYGLGLGSPDLVGCVQSGRFIGVEVKTKSGRVSEDQKAWAHAWNSRGAYVCVARSVEEAIEHALRAAQGLQAPEIP